MGDTVTRVNHGSSEGVFGLVACPRCRKCQNRLNRNVHSFHTKGLEENLGRVFTVLWRIQRRFGLLLPSGARFMRELGQHTSNSEDSIPRENSGLQAHSGGTGKCRLDGTSPSSPKTRLVRDGLDTERHMFGNWPWPRLQYKSPSHQCHVLSSSFHPLHCRCPRLLTDCSTALPALLLPLG